MLCFNLLKALLEILNIALEVSTGTSLCPKCSLIGWSVCHNFLNGWKVTLPCSYQSTCKFSRCTACEFTGNSEIHYNAHINGKKHSKKLKSLGHHNRLETKTGNQEVGNGGQQAGSAHQDSACKGGRQSAEGDPAKATDWATYKARLNQSPTGVQPKSKSITTSISSKTADEAIKKEAFVARKMAVLATSQESCDERVVGGRMPDGAKWGCDNRGVGGGGGSAVQALKRKAGSITSISSKSDFRLK